MLYSKRFTKIILTVLTVVLCFLCVSPVAAYADEGETQEIYIGGFTAGFVLNTTTVEVVGLCEVLTDNGMDCPARTYGIKSGDVIDKVNDRVIRSSGDLTAALNEDYKKYIVTVIRDGKAESFEVSPAVDKVTRKKRLGLLVKDSVNGIGTVTYIDKTNNKFGSLGHPVNDAQGKIIDINGGSIYGCIIYGVKQGMRGNPGELKGSFENNNMMGKVCKNCNCGIFGDIAADFDASRLIKTQVCKLSEVTPGKAEIYSTLNGNTPEKYDISIIKVDEYNKDNRNFVIRIDDEKLIGKSGGIVQGMSGSPIIQNGKLVGAVTHVFVNDPTRGYGIGIDKMLGSY